MAHRKKIEVGVNERLTLLSPVFPDIDRQNRPPGVAKDDLLDAAVAAWTALRVSNGEALRHGGAANRRSLFSLPLPFAFLSFLDEMQRHNLQSALPLRYDPADTKQSCASTRKLGSVLLGQELPNQNQH